MAEPNVTPQQALKKAQHDLAVALRGALQALESPAATPGLMGVAMQALAQAQNQWNAAVSRIPLEVMTDGITIQPETEARDAMGEMPHDAHPAASLHSPNPRVWADHFLAANKNEAITRESLAEWFMGAMATAYGRGAAGAGLS